MGWWDEKLGVTRQQQAPSQQRQAPRFNPEIIPRGMGQRHEQALNHYLQQQEGFQPLEDAADSIDGDPHGYHKRLKRYEGNPQAGLRESYETGQCPHCGSWRYLSRTNGQWNQMNASGMMVSPAPECMECGYPRLQYSSGAVSGPGRGAPARQGKPAGPLTALRFGPDAGTVVKAISKM